MLLCALTSAVASAGEAFDKARLHGTPYVIENLLIGCTTDPMHQEVIAKTYAPSGHHMHKGDHWVSFDLDPSIAPDINADVRMLDKIIKSIEKSVYIEHFNDLSMACATYQGELLKKCYALMKPGAKLYMDYYPSITLSDNEKKEDFFFNSENSPYGVNFDVDSTQNPFWAAASFGHFKAGMKAGSAFDTFGGRQAVLDKMVCDIKEDSRFMAGIPSHVTAQGPAARAAYLLGVANATLDERLATSPMNCWGTESKLFYGARNKENVKAFLTKIGFTPALILPAGTNSFNGRKGELMIVAVKPLVSATSGSTVEGPTADPKAGEEKK